MVNDQKKIIDKAKEQLDEFNSQLNELEVKLKDLGAEAKKIYHEQAPELRKLLKEAQEKFEAAKDTSGENWEEVKGQIELTRKALRNSFHYFLSHYKKK
jgi:ElaB/YqjD/DUF883 family membrane-anchored ribosome-binding protein